MILAVALLAVAGCIDSREWDSWKCERLGVQPGTEAFIRCVERLQREREEWFERRIRANEMSSEG